MDGGAWQTTVHRVAKSWTRLSNFTSLPREEAKPGGQHSVEPRDEKKELPEDSKHRGPREKVRLKAEAQAAPIGRVAAATQNTILGQTEQTRLLELLAVLSRSLPQGNLTAPRCAVSY